MTALKAKTTPLIEIHHPLFVERNIKVYVKLDYMGHTEVQGNKFHKLNLNLNAFMDKNYSTIVTFGGAYSNHIAATAAAAKAIKANAIGIIRGEELAQDPNKWSHTLKQAQDHGMQFKFVSRNEYRLRNNEDYLAQLKLTYPSAFVLPEGGTNLLAIQGFKPLMQQINQQNPHWTHLYTAVGTGGTLAGLYSYASIGANEVIANKKERDYKPIKQLIGIACLKGADYLKQDIANWIEQNSKAVKNKAFCNEQCAIQTLDSNTEWQLLTHYHHGGYAKQTAELTQFKNQFESQFNIPLDRVYTSKTFYAFFKELEKGHIAPNSQVILYHSGGLQGNKPH